MRKRAEVRHQLHELSPADGYFDLFTSGANRGQERKFANQLGESLASTILAGLVLFKVISAPHLPGSLPIRPNILPIVPHGTGKNQIRLSQMLRIGPAAVTVLFY